MTPRDLGNIHSTRNSCRDTLSCAQRGTKTIPVFLPADGEASWSLFPSSVTLLSGSTVQPENSYSCILKVTGQDWERLLGYSYSAANKGRLTVNYRQSLAFDWPYLSCDDHCDQWLFQEIFLSLSFSFHRNSLEWSWTCFLEIVKHSKQFSIPYSRVDI